MPENKPVHTTPQRESAPDFSTREVDNLYRNTPQFGGGNSQRQVLIVFIKSNGVTLELLRIELRHSR